MKYYIFEFCLVIANISEKPSLFLVTCCNNKLCLNKLMYKYRILLNFSSQLHVINIDLTFAVNKMLTNKC